MGADSGHPMELRRRLRYVWMSPPCRTSGFSKVDAVNTRRGMGYRDHSRKSRPPLKTVRGNLAADHDNLVKEWMAFARCMRAAGEVHWTI